MKTYSIGFEQWLTKRVERLEKEAKEAQLRFKAAAQDLASMKVGGKVTIQTMTAYNNWIGMQPRNKI